MPGVGMERAEADVHQSNSSSALGGAQSSACRRAFGRCLQLEIPCLKQHSLIAPSLTTLPTAVITSWAYSIYRNPTTSDTILIMGLSNITADLCSSIPSTLCVLILYSSALGARCVARHEGRKCLRHLLDALCDGWGGSSIQVIPQTCTELVRMPAHQLLPQAGLDVGRPLWNERAREWLDCRVR
eukprot:1140479-Pelagomonas_calceolata.AAC.4